MKAGAVRRDSGRRANRPSTAPIQAVEAQAIKVQEIKAQAIKVREMGAKP